MANKEGKWSLGRRGKIEEGKVSWKEIFLCVVDFWFLPRLAAHVFPIWNKLPSPGSRERPWSPGPPLRLHTPLPPCAPVAGSSGSLGLEDIPQLAPGLWIWHPPQKHTCLSVTTCAQQRAFILIEASHLDIGWQAFLGYCRPLLGPSRSPREGCGILSLLPPALQFQCIVTCWIALAPVLEWAFLHRFLTVSGGLSVGRQVCRAGDTGQRLCRKHASVAPAWFLLCSDLGLRTVAKTL